MGKKYIIEIIGGEEGDMDFSTIEPYTEPDMEQVRKEAYDKGYDDATAEIGSDEQAIAEKAYKKGLSDAWEAAKKIANMPYNEEEKVFGSGGWTFIDKHTATEAIEKIRQYEQEKEEIQVGDEVNAPFGKAIVVNIDSVAKKIWLVYADGHGGFEYFKDAPTKTGRHFPEIAEVFAKMKETDNG